MKKQAVGIAPYRRGVASYSLAARDYQSQFSTRKEVEQVNDESENFVIELDPSRRLLKVRNAVLEEDAESGQIVVYLDQMGELIQVLVIATLDLVSIVIKKKPRRGTDASDALDG